MQSYWTRFMTQRIRRRRALAGLGAVGVGAALLAACGGDDDGGTSTGATGGTGATGSTGATGATGTTGATSGGEPVKDRLVIGIPYTGDEFNDPRWNNAGSTWQIRPQWDTLIALDASTGERTGYLAEEWEVREADQSIYVKLRPGVKMHDGNTMTAEDVKASFEWVDQLLDHPISAAGYMYELIGEIETPSELELIIHLQKPDAQIFSLFIGDLYTYWMVYSKADLEKRGSPTTLIPLQEPMLAGTGPWQYVSRTPAENILFKRFDEHYRKVPDFKELEFRIINEDSTRLAALLAGEVDIVPLPPDLQETAIERGMQRIIARVPGNRVFLDFLGCTVDVDTHEYLHPDNPLLDLRVRKALNKAIDRDALNEAFLAGRGEKMILNHFHPTRDGWDPSWESRWEEEYGYDPDAAKALLEAAGYTSSSPFRTTLYFTEISAFPQSGDVLETIVGYWRAIGVDVNFETIDAATLTSRVENQEVVNAMRMSITSSPVDVGFDVYNGDRRGWTRGLGAGYSGFTSYETSQKYIDNLTVLDPEKYAATMREIGEKSFAEHFGVPLFWINPEVVVNPNVVAGWDWHGSKSGIYTDTEYIQAVKK